MTNWTAVIQTLVEAKADVNEARQVVVVRLGGGRGCFNTRWWFQTFFIFTPKIGEMIEFDYIYI